MSATSLFEDTNPHDLKELLGQIHSKELALPDFQRDFVWDPAATQELIVSIASSYPAGSILRIRNSQNLFAPRAFDGAPELNGQKPTYLVLDGQQRLTSLYQAFYGVGDHRYFVNLRDLLEKRDFEEAIFHLRADHKRTFALQTLDRQVSDLVLPLRVIFGEKGGFSAWVLRVSDSFQDPGKSRELRDQLLNGGAWVSGIDDYKFPVVTLSERTQPEAVCTIFETLNRTGVKLSVFELLTARFWAEDLNLRDLWARALEADPLLARFELDPYYLLQIAALLRKDAAPSCKRSDVLRLTAPLVRNTWDDVLWGVGEAFAMLRDDGGVWLPQWLPYSAMVIPMGAILAQTRDLRGPEVAAARLKIGRWYWCCVFGQTYENSPNSQAAVDVREVVAWIRGGAVPAAIRSFRFDPQVLRTATPRQRALYRGAMGLVLRQSPRDFHKGKRLDGDLLLSGYADDHHVFPAAYLNRLKVPERVRDGILNRTLIDRDTNHRIGARPPSQYLDEIRRELGAAFPDVLESHSIPASESALTGLMRDDFESFQIERLSLLVERIREVTGAVLSDGILTAPEAASSVGAPGGPEDLEENDDDDDEGDPEGAPSGFWKIDGRKWHLEYRASDETAALLLNLLDLMQKAVPQLEVGWGQKHYVALKYRGGRWAEFRVGRLRIKLILWTWSSRLDARRVSDTLRLPLKEPGRGAGGAPSYVIIRPYGSGYIANGIVLRPDHGAPGAALQQVIEEWWRLVREVAE